MESVQRAVAMRIQSQQSRVTSYQFTAGVGQYRCGCIHGNAGMDVNDYCALRQAACVLPG